MSYRNHVNYVRLVKVNDCERETVQKKAAGTMQIFRRARRRFADGFNR